MYMLCNTVWYDMSCVRQWVERDQRWKDMYDDGRYQARQVRHGEEQYGNLMLFNHSKCDELAWCSQALTRYTESIGCVVWRARQEAYNSQLFGAFVSVMGHLKLFYRNAHVIWGEYEVRAKYFGMVTTYG